MYRLAAWKDKNDMMGAPDIMAEGGIFSKPGYTFKSEDYSYAVINQLLVQDELRLYANVGKLFFFKQVGTKSSGLFKSLFVSPFLDGSVIAGKQNGRHFHSVINFRTSIDRGRQEIVLK